nr:WG repeat-containing protein [uncultured Flavobacterium sp.]
MKKHIIFLLVIFFAGNLLIAQKLKFDLDDPSYGFLELAQKSSSTAGKSVYFLKEYKLVNTKAESDVYADVSEKDNVVTINSFYTSNDKKAIAYEFIRKNGKLELNALSFLSEEGTLVAGGQNLSSAKGLLIVRPGLFEVRIFIYRDGKRQENFYYYVSQINNNIQVASANDMLQGILNGVGDLIVPTIYTELKSLNNDLFIGTKASDKTGVFDITGKEIIPFKYDQIISIKLNSYNDVVLQFQKSEKDFDFFYIIDKDSDKKSKYGIYNKKGVMISPPVNDFISFDLELAPVKSESGKYGYINKFAELVIPFQYADANSFSQSDKLAPVTNDEGKMGYINTSNVLVIPYNYYSASQFQGGKAWVIEKSGKKGYYIDTLGNKTE